MLKADPDALSGAINRFVDGLIADFGGVFDAIAAALLRVLLLADGLFRDHPYLLLFAAIAAAPCWLWRGPGRAPLIASGALLFLFILISALGWPARLPEAVMWLSLPFAVGCLAGAFGRRWRLAAGLMLALGAIRWLGLWDLAMQSLALTLSALVLSVAAGLPLGIAAGVSARFRAGLRPLLDLMQTMPSFVYLIPALMLFGLGKVPALIATFIYATPPLVRLTDHGIRTASPAAVEAAIAFGATRMQRLLKVELPLAAPTILQGLNQTTMLALSMVVIASMIGARGLGEEVLLGIQRLDVGRGVLAGTAIVLLAVVLDRLTEAVGAAMRPGGRRP